MGDSRRRVDGMGADRGGGRGPGGRPRAGAPASQRVRARIYALAALVGLSSGLELNRAARAQQPEAPQPAAPAQVDVQDLSLRYRFLERYGLSEDLGRPDQLVQYQVGAFETTRREIEQPRGAPERQEITFQTVYTERAAKLGRLGEVTDTVRRYDVFRPVGAGQADPRASTLLKGLVLWFHPRSTGFPEVIALTPNRSIRQLEYETILGQIFTPRLTAILPTRPALRADKWPISRQAARVLLGKVPDAGNLQLECTLSNVAKVGDGTAMAAIIDLEGVLDFEEGTGAVRARLWFVFEPLRAGAGAAPKEASGPSATGAAARDAGVIEARGYVSRLVMSVRKSLPLDENGRLQQIQTGELHLERRPWRPSAADPELLAAPKDAPPADETNSWIVLDDPQGRFHFRHPQGFQVTLPEPGDYDIEMVQPNPNGKSDVLLLTPVPKDRRKGDPQAFVRELKDQWTTQGFELVQGPAGWLPEAEWAPLKRRVYRVQTAIKPDEKAGGPRGAARVYLDAYQVQFSRGDIFYLRAMTEREDHMAVRDQAEKLLKTLDLGPSAPGMAGPATQRPGTSPPAATAPPAVTAPPAATAPSGATAPAPDPRNAPPVPRLDRRP